jgi:BlaI family transcriptional regulator, penicillinase repressor
MPDKGIADFSEFNLSRRERQIMSAVYRLGRATIAEIVANIPQPPSPDAIRRLSHILEEKGLLNHEQAGNRNIYFPLIRPELASKNALDHVVETFFGGSPHKLVAALLDIKKDKLDSDELQRLAEMIDNSSIENSSEESRK